MWLIGDVHGAFEAMGRVCRLGEPVVVLGDLLNFIDYRSLDGILADVFGKPMVAEVVALRAAGDFGAARARWQREAEGREGDIRRLIVELVGEQYRQAAAALAGCEAYVIPGNVDWPELLRAALPDGVRYVDGEVVEIEGWRVGFAGGGAPTPLGVPGEISEADMEAKLNGLGPVDVLCCHSPPPAPPLSWDVVAGRHEAGFQCVLDYIVDVQPAAVYFGDVHQPQAVHWRIGRTVCRNAGYFRATHRPLRHG